jgi:diphthamide synthase (EF-2-diphthine--ammonia ligase)
MSTRRSPTSCPPTSTPCGESGEFHSFASAGPMSGAPIAIDIGEVVERDWFVFAAVLPAART